MGSRRMKIASAVATGSVNDASLKRAFWRRMRPVGSKVALPKVTVTPDWARWSSMARRRNLGTCSSLTVPI